MCKPVKNKFLSHKLLDLRFPESEKEKRWKKIEKKNILFIAIHVPKEMPIEKNI